MEELNERELSEKLVRFWKNWEYKNAGEKKICKPYCLELKLIFQMDSYGYSQVWPYHRCLKCGAVYTASIPENKDVQISSSLKEELEKREREGRILHLKVQKIEIERKLAELRQEKIH